MRQLNPCKRVASSTTGTWEARRRRTNNNAKPSSWKLRLRANETAAKRYARGVRARRYCSVYHVSLINEGLSTGYPNTRMRKIRSQDVTRNRHQHPPFPSFPCSARAPGAHTSPRSVRSAVRMQRYSRQALNSTCSGPVASSAALSSRIRIKRGNLREMPLSPA